jgi:hypothetical protein
VGASRRLAEWVDIAPPAARRRAIALPSASTSPASGRGEEGGTQPHPSELILQIEPCAFRRDLFLRGTSQEAAFREALMTDWRDSMVDRPTEEGAYTAGWTVSGLAVLGAIVAIWVFGI